MGTRGIFGLNIGDTVCTLNSSGALGIAPPTTPLTAWTDPNTGTQITDLTDMSGNPTVTISPNVNGNFAFKGPDPAGTFGAWANGMWVDAGDGYRVWITPIQLDTVYTPRSLMGVANGLATLDGTGRVPASQLTLDALEYKGTWNAATNTPTLANGTGNAGDFYKVATGGSHDFGAGAITFVVGDSLFYDGAAWQRVSARDGVASVVGQSGDVTGAQIAADPALTATYVGQWRTGNVYAVNDRAIFPDGTIVKCATAHTASASYNADLLAGDWLILVAPATAQGVSVAAYGAVIDGSTDDSAAWAAAILAQAALGARIFQPPGTSVATGLTVAAMAHITLLAGATLLHKAGATAPLFTMPIAGTSLRIDGPGTIDGNKANQTTRNALISANIPQGDEVILDRVKLRNFFQGIYATNFGGLIGVDFCDVAGQAEHDGTLGHSTMIINVQSGQQITSGAKGRIRFNHNHCIGTATPSLAGGSPGGIFYASNGYDNTGGGGPGTAGFANGNGSTLEAVGNYFYGYGQNCGGNDIAPLHFYPASGGARIIGNYFEGCGFSAIAAKSVDNFICSDNVILNGQTSTQNTATEGAISYVPGYQAASTRRTRAVISGNIVLNPGGDAANDQQAGINCTGTSTSQANDVTIANNIVAGGGIACRVTQAQDVKIIGNNFTGGTTSASLADHGIYLSSVTGRVDINDNKVTVSNGHGLSAITSVNTASMTINGNEFKSTNASTYACTVRGAAFAKFAGNVFDGAGTAISLTTDGTNPIGWLAWDASNTIKAGSASFVWASITKATGTLAATGSPLGSVTPGEIGTAYRQTNGSGDSILWIANGLTNTSWVKELQLTSQSVGEPFASLGMIGGNFNPDLAITGQAAQPAGVLDVCRYTLPAGGGVSNVYVAVAAAGVGLSNTFMAVFDDAGNLLGQSADISTTMQSAGNKTIALTATTAGVGVGAAINVALLVGAATTMPQLRGINGTGAPNIGITATAKNRRAFALSSVATLNGALSTGSPITTIPVTATTQTLVAGNTVILISGANTQTFTVAAPGASIGATSIPVNSQTPNFAYASGLTVGIGLTAIPSTLPSKVAVTTNWFCGVS